MPRLLLATGNQAKVSEYRSLLRSIAYELVTPAEIGLSVGIDEVGATLEDNARLKAVGYSGESQLMALADDSGLEVDALGGGPGPLTARYAGENASDGERVSFLLSHLTGIPWEKRSARFRCVIAIATPEGRLELCSANCYGFIALSPRGEHGFGYDPIFYLPELDKTMAELPMAVKNQVSHRGKAARKARCLLKRPACGQ